METGMRAYICVYICVKGGCGYVRVDGGGVDFQCHFLSYD